MEKLRYSTVLGYRYVLQKQSFAGVFQNRCLKNFANFTGKHLSWNLFFNKVAGQKACNFIKNRLQHRCFHVHFAKLLRATLLQSTSSACFCSYIVRVKTFSNPSILKTIDWKKKPKYVNIGDSRFSITHVQAKITILHSLTLQFQ